MALGFWAKDYLGPKEAGGGAFVVTFTAPTSGTEISNVDKTFDEVLSALKSGACVIAKLTGLPAPDQYIYCSKYSETSITFSSGSAGFGTLNLVSIDFTKYGATYHSVSVSS